MLIPGSRLTATDLVFVTCNMRMQTVGNILPSVSEQDSSHTGKETFVYVDYSQLSLQLS